MIAVDTSVLVDLFRGRSTPAVERLKQLEKDQTPFSIPAICCQELLQGARDKREWNLLIDERWCERLSVAGGDVLSAAEMCRKLGEVDREIVEIYREIPAQRTLERLEKLKRGLRFYLEG